MYPYRNEESSRSSSDRVAERVSIIALAVIIMSVYAAAMCRDDREHAVAAPVCPETTVVCEMRDTLEEIRFEIEMLRIEHARLDSIIQLSTTYDVPPRTAAAIYDAAVANGVPVALAFDLAWVESAYDTTAVSPAGAIGLTQVMPRTAWELRPGVTREALMHPHVNAAIGLRYLRQLLDEHDGDVNLALLSYNRGPSRVAFLLRRGRDPANGYARAVCRGPCEGRM